MQGSLKALCMLCALVVGCLSSESVVEPFLPVAWLYEHGRYMPVLLCFIQLGMVAFYMKTQQQLYRKLEETFSEAAQHKDMWMRTVSHELRSPLHGVIMSVNLLQTEKNPTEQAELLRNASHCSSLLHLLINNLLMGNGPPSKNSMTATEIDVRAFVGKVEAIVSSLACDRRLSVTQVQSRNLGPRVGIPDELLLMQIVLNYVSNACKVAVSRVEVLIHGDGKNLLVSVLDDGPGVAPPLRSHLFSGKPRELGLKGTGAGLGLSICNTLATAMGGRVWYEPGPKGVGSLFHLSVPLLRQTVTPSNVAPLMWETSATPPLLPVPKKRAQDDLYVIIDDNVINRRVLAQFLKRLRRSSVAFGEGPSALEWLLSQVRIGCLKANVTVFLDVEMPMMNGFSVASLWRHIERCVEGLNVARIILVSATHFDALPLDVDLVLQKPLTVEQLQLVL